MGRKKKEEILEEMKEKIKEDNKAKKATKKEAKVETKTEEQIKDEVKDIVEKAKDGKMTYAELATKLDNINPEQIDKVFDKFEEIGVDILADEFEEEEPDLEDLKEVEDIKVDDNSFASLDGINVDDPVRMYLR